MGILTTIADTYDEEERVQRIFAVTRLDFNNRSAINRVTSRAAVMTGAGQRTLTVAAFDENDIDVVWRDGPVSVTSPEEKFPDAKKINYMKEEIDSASEFGDITNIPDKFIPRGTIGDALVEGIDAFRPDEQFLHVWEIPYEVGGRDL